jgi:hypothetical protein
MSEPEGADSTADFGVQPTTKSEAATGEATHTSGYMEAPTQVAGAAAEDEGAARPQLSEGRK